MHVRGLILRSAVTGRYIVPESPSADALLEEAYAAQFDAEHVVEEQS